MFSLAILATAYGKLSQGPDGADMQPWRLDDVNVQNDVLEGIKGQVLEDLDSEDLQDLDSDVVSNVATASLRVADQDVDRKLQHSKIGTNTFWNKIKETGRNFRSNTKKKINTFWNKNGGIIRSKIRKLNKFKTDFKRELIALKNKIRTGGDFRSELIQLCDKYWTTLQGGFSPEQKKQFLNKSKPQLRNLKNKLKTYGTKITFDKLLNAIYGFFISDF